ncbi:MAG: GH3 auxin-responsive promoter family protein [Candidatus Melainabacteria bacterium]|nr:GH3 auxin-responsive promoter family protein [Candidatus Melainabacteria bacterium]
MLRKAVYKLFSRLAAEEAESLERACRAPREAQLKRLNSILAAAKDTKFGREHGFAAIKTYKDFQAAMPIADYETFRPYVDRMTAGEKGILTRQDPFMFATTSGTTGSQKFIPVTQEYVVEYRRASRVSCFHLYRCFPKMAEGCSLAIASPSVQGRTPAGIPFGAISGALYQTEPEAIRDVLVSVPYEVLTIPDYETRYYCILRAALANPVTSIYTVNPSTIAVMARRLQKHGETLARDLFDGTLTAPGTVPKSIVDKMSHLIRIDRQGARILEKLVEADSCVPQRVWPNLQNVSCWTKAAASFYLNDFNDLFGSVPICDVTYGASEGRGTVFLSQNQQVLAIRSHFFEFIPEAEIHSPEPPVLLADELIEGETYYILFTTSGGLYRYNINDVVKVTGFHNLAPLLEFQYKGGATFSFTGEKITELQVTESMKLALEEQSFQARFFTVIPEFRPMPHYSLWLEPGAAERTLDAALQNKLARSFDRQLAMANTEYADKRRSMRLEAASVRILKPGSYEMLRQNLVAKGIADSQIKLSHLNPQDETREFLVGRLA